jgi:hypothetical protein
MSDVSDIERTHDLSEYSNNIVATNKPWHNRKSENNTVIQFIVSNPALNHVVHLISYHIMSYQIGFFIILSFFNYVYILAIQKYFTKCCGREVSLLLCIWEVSD